MLANKTVEPLCESHRGSVKQLGIPKISNDQSYYSCFTGDCSFSAIYLQAHTREDAQTFIDRVYFKKDDSKTSVTVKIDSITVRNGATNFGIRVYCVSSNTYTSYFGNQTSLTLSDASEIRIEATFNTAVDNYLCMNNVEVY